MRKHLLHVRKGARQRVSRQEERGLSWSLGWTTSLGSRGGTRRSSGTTVLQSWDSWSFAKSESRGRPLTHHSVLSLNPHGPKGQSWRLDALDTVCNHWASPVPVVVVGGHPASVKSATDVCYKTSELKWNKSLLQEALSDPHVFRTQGRLLPFHLKALHCFVTSLTVGSPSLYLLLALEARNPDRDQS